MSTLLQPGKLVSLRGREWVVLPSDDPDLLVIFLGVNRITGDEIRTVLRRLGPNGRAPGSASALALRSPGLGAAIAGKSRTKSGAQSPGVKPE